MNADTKKSKGFRNTFNYRQTPIVDTSHLDVTKRSDISDNSKLDITKNVDDSAHSFLFPEQPYEKKVN